MFFYDKNGEIIYLFCYFVKIVQAYLLHVDANRYSSKKFAKMYSSQLNGFIYIMLKIKSLLIFIICLLIPQFALTAEKHALLIGIQDYSKTSFNSLEGSINDINLTKRLLQERFGFQNKDFIILLDAQATHTGIERAFKLLTDKVQADDFVYIYYSGHGSQTKDLNGDEPSGMDQTWVSYGSRASADSQDKDNYDVLDDEINAWLSALYAKTKKVVFVSDSCHSATVARGPAAPIRAVKADKRPHLLGKQIYTQPVIYHGIRIGAAQDYQSAIEWVPPKNGQYYGMFTWYWVQNLQQAKKKDTWNQVFKRVAAKIQNRRGVVQQPYIEGDSLKQVLGEGFAPLVETFSVKPLGDDWIEIQAGSLAGVTKGSVYRLYNPEMPNSLLPRLTIEVVQPFESYGVPEIDGTFHKGDSIIEESHAYHFLPIKVSLEADFPNSIDKQLLKKIKFAFQQTGKQSFPAYTLVDNPSQATLRLYLLRPKLKNGKLIRANVDDALPQSFANQSPELWILTQEQRLLYKNLKVPFDNPKAGLAKLREHLKKLASARELKELKSPRDKKLPVSVQVSVLKEVNSCPKGTKCVRLPNDLFYSVNGSHNLETIQGQTFNKGEILDFTLENNSKYKPYYFYLINIAADNAINVIFPHPAEPLSYARLKLGEKRKLTEEVVLFMGDVGIETLKVIISTKPIDVRLFEQSGLKNFMNPLERLLNNASHGLRQETLIWIDEWATEQVVFEVK